MSDLRLEDFDYELPGERIAQHPPAERDGGRLMCVDRRSGAVSHHRIVNLPALVPPRCLMVCNDTRVFPARLLARRQSGGRVELLLLEEIAAERWRCMLRSSKRLRRGETLTLLDRQGGEGYRGQAVVASEVIDGRCEVTLETARALDRAGTLPLPPYIRRDASAADDERYQTVYAQKTGSVAAPTAGLHFSPRLLARLEEAGVERRALTLHVGPGTFQPVRSGDLTAHRIEAERYQLPASTASAITAARSAGRRILAVGTTVVRTLEATGGRAGLGHAGLFIRPGHPFAVVDALLTNFHLPRSTLLMLVCAFGGYETVFAAYREAIAHDYRFYSYGDAMLIQ